MGRRRFEVTGTVQGVGFRPWAVRVAEGLGVVGWIANESGRVVGEVDGDDQSTARFLELVGTGPPGAAVTGARSWPSDVLGNEPRFEVRVGREPEPMGSDRPAAGSSLPTSSVAGWSVAGWSAVAADRATCDACLAELEDPSDRRYRHAFISCPSCGPRATIAVTPPWTRAHTTMARFDLCRACRAEFDDVDDRRFHHEAICCRDCGPRLVVPVGASDEFDDPVAAAARVIGAGGVIALKALGGYQLVCDARRADAVARIRALKRRPDQPLAVMVPGLDWADRLGEIDEVARAAVCSPEAPIVVAPAPVAPAAPNSAEALAPGVRAHSAWLGLFLPSTPLHHLVLSAAGGPLVVTSANRSGEPIIVDDEAVIERFGAEVDLILAHDRDIALAADDSVVRVPPAGRDAPGAPMLLRRARGWVPGGGSFPVTTGRAILGVGAELKSTVCVADGAQWVMSPHLGDLSDPDTRDRFEATVGRWRQGFGGRPWVLAHDQHPGYASTRAAELIAASDERVELVAVQHHHAHVAACLAEHGEVGPAIGVVFDGLGWGPDGTAWGGEILLADLVEARRVGALETVPMPGGLAAIREPWRMAAAWLDAVGVDVAGHFLVESRRDDWDSVLALSSTRSVSPLTSSVGRLFDAVAAILGLADGRLTFEGQAAVALEQAVDVREFGAYRAGISTGADGLLRLGVGELVAAVEADRRVGVAVSVISARFHRGLAELTAQAVERAREVTGVSVVALSGGVFQNVVLTGLLSELLETRGFRVLTHFRVPPNDGGLSLGQVAVAAAQRGGA